MATDARVRYTKMMIQAKFLLLLEKKPINKITVKEICELAEINRATFYKYYMDAYDLLDKIEEEILSELENTIHSSLNEGVNNTLIKMLKKMKESGILNYWINDGMTESPEQVAQFIEQLISNTLKTLS